MSFGVWISMKSRSTHQLRSACTNVVWIAEHQRAASGRRRSRKRQSRRLSTLESSAMGVSGHAAATISRVADLDLDAAELHALVVLELAGRPVRKVPWR